MPFIVLAVLLAVLSPVETSVRSFRLQPELRSVRLQAEASQPAALGRLREDTVESPALGRAMRYRVLLPENYESSLQRYPVLYLLHGLGGNYTDWTTRSNVAEYSRTLPLIIVMPDGGNQWYTNADDGSARYEDYILTDLQADVVKKYRTINSRYGRAIAGLSMGGFGALKLALKRPAAFAVAGSFSGAFGATRDGELERLIGAGEAERMRSIFGPAGSKTRAANDLFTLAAALKPAAAPYVYIDCGIADNSLIAANREVVAALHTAGVAYEYHEVPGAHTWDYWDRRVREFLPLLLRRLAN